MCTSLFNKTHTPNLATILETTLYVYTIHVDLEIFTIKNFCLWHSAIKIKYMYTKILDSDENVNIFEMKFFEGENLDVHVQGRI